MSKLVRYFTICFVLFIHFGLYAQENGKIEFERRVSKDQFPAQIIKELSTYLDAARRVRFYQEFDGTRYSWEVKMVYNRKVFSIEYGSDLSLLDIEVLENWRWVSPSIKEPLADYFDKHYERHRIRRVQLQFLPQPGQTPEEFIASILRDDLPQAQSYELEGEVKGIANKEFGFYEFLFDHKFQLIEKRKIIPISDVNLHF